MEMNNQAEDRRLTPLSEHVARFVERPHKLLIDGSWQDAVSDKTFEVRDPSTGRTIAAVAEADARDVDRAVAAARSAFDDGSWARLNGGLRAKLLWRIADAIEAASDELAEIEALDNGKSISVARAVDVPMTVDVFRYMAGWTTKITGTTRSASSPIDPSARFFPLTLRQPIGVAGLITPWNFPLVQAGLKLAPALAAGCTTVLKPAEDTPLATLRLGELLLDAGVPDGVVNIVTGFGDVVGSAITAHPEVDKVSFTGSTEVGRKVLTAAAGNMKKVTLELGGNAPNIVLADADVEAAVAGAANAGFFNHGQLCTAGRRLYVEKPIFDEVVDGLAQAASAMSVGPGLDPGTEVGPLVSEKQFERVLGYLDGGGREGASYLAGGKKRGGDGYFVEPTVAVGMPDDAAIVREEVFGPLVAAMPFDELDEVVNRANDTSFGLAAGLWTSNLTKALSIAESLKSGTVWINCYNVLDVALPHGGYKQSGWGREMGLEAVHAFMEAKTVTIGMP
jgi:phenylacetaldehyde dehydrogenase